MVLFQDTPNFIFQRVLLLLPVEFVVYAVYTGIIPTVNHYIALWHEGQSLFGGGKAFAHFKNSM